VRASLFVVVLTACGSDAMTIGLVAPGEPSFFKGQIAGGSWQTFTGTFDGRATSYELAIDGDFELVMVCEYASGTFVAGELFGTADDAPVTIGTWHVPSCAEAEAVAPEVEVTGMLDAQGLVAIADANAFVLDPTEPFSLSIAPGVHDIAITNNNFEVAIEHDVAITSALDLGTLTLHGSSMVTNNYSASLTPDEVADAWSQVDTRNGTSLVFNFDPKMAVFVTPDQLAYGDVQSFHFVVQGDGNQRSAVATGFSATPPQFELLQPLMPYGWTPSEHAVRWPPIGDFYSTLRVEFSGAEGTETATASKLWLERHVATRIAFDETEPPGYRWQTLAPTASLTAELWSPDLVLTSSTTRAH
jgi:hypothetical protein